MAAKAYLGDGVYAAFDGWHVVLTTENGSLRPTNTIALEPDVYEALVRYVENPTVWGPRPKEQKDA